MITVGEARALAQKLMELNAVWSTQAAGALFRLADQVEYLEERDEISDSKLQLFRDLGNDWQADAIAYQAQLNEQIAINVELKKQVIMLREALMKS
jgi:hypothetical protein